MTNKDVIDQLMYGHSDISNESTISIPNSFIIASTNSITLYILHFHSCNFSPIIVNPAHCSMFNI